MPVLIDDLTIEPTTEQRAKVLAWYQGTLGGREIVSSRTHEEDLIGIVLGEWK